MPKYDTQNVLTVAGPSYMQSSPDTGADMRGEDKENDSRIGIACDYVFSGICEYYSTCN